MIRILNQINVISTAYINFINNVNIKLAQVGFWNKNHKFRTFIIYKVSRSQSDQPTVVNMRSYISGTWSQLVYFRPLGEGGGEISPNPPFHHLCIQVVFDPRIKMYEKNDTKTALLMIPRMMMGERGRGTKREREKMASRLECGTGSRDGKSFWRLSEGKKKVDSLRV